jgi:hypothetical protein
MAVAVDGVVGRTTALGDLVGGVLDEAARGEVFFIPFKNVCRAPPQTHGKGFVVHFSDLCCATDARQTFCF